MKFTLIASLLFASVSLFAAEATDETTADSFYRLAACTPGVSACTAEYDPSACDIVYADNGQFVTTTSGSNRCMAVENFRTRQCEAHLKNPSKFADASIFAAGNCRKN